MAYNLNHIIVEGLIVTLALVLAFEYENWRASSNNFTVVERFFVVMLTTWASMALVYELAHGNLRLFGTTYGAPTHEA